MQQAEFDEHVGAENICPNITAALDRAACCTNGISSHAVRPVQKPVPPRSS